MLGREVLGDEAVVAADVQRSRAVQGDRREAGALPASPRWTRTARRAGPRRAPLPQPAGGRVPRAGRRPGRRCRARTAGPPPAAGRSAAAAPRGRRGPASTRPEPRPRGPRGGRSPRPAGSASTPSSTSTKGLAREAIAAASRGSRIRPDRRRGERQCGHEGRVERLDPVEGRGQMAQQREGIAVAVVERQPHERTLVARRPLGQQGGLAVARGGDDRDQTVLRLPAETVHQPDPGHRPGARRRDAELRLEDRERERRPRRARRAAGGGGSGRGLLRVGAMADIGRFQASRIRAPLPSALPRNLRSACTSIVLQ